MKNFKKIKSSGYGQNRKKTSSKLKSKNISMDPNHFSILGLVRHNKLSLDEASTNE